MNFLSGSALNLVEKETDYHKIREKLLSAYGNPRVLLQNKLADLDLIGGLWKLRGDQKIFDGVASLVNKMKDLGHLAAEHNIGGQLYEGGGLEKVFSLIGNDRHRRFREKHIDLVDDKRREWDKIREFLEKELKVKEKLIIDRKNASMMGFQKPKRGLDNDSGLPNDGTQGKSTHVAQNDDLKCHICDEVGHTVITTAKGKKIIPYYVCKKFSQMSPGDRHKILDSKNLCPGCLCPGARKGPNHKCFYTKFFCPISSHSERLHVLVCEAHKKDAQNLDILSKFKEKFINNCKIDLPPHAKSISCFSEMSCVAQNQAVVFNEFSCEAEITDSAIFMLQRIRVEKKSLNIFYDNGCGDMCITKFAVDKLMKVGCAKVLIPGPL